MNPLTTLEMYIYCAILGDNTAFPIDIDPTMTVGHLKVEIKRSKHTLDSIDADILRLFWVECPMPQEIYSALMASIQQGTVQFDRKIELGFPPCILSTIRFAPGNLHILVEVPAGESFSPCPDRDVAEVVTPVLQLPKTLRCNT